ncbi:glycosyltransferase family 4 protein [Cellulomonas hominis]|uniref:glycosyltransferase family 4 protein n=1 Tax=Cellulomonas hominis TaxID=156981 RepID=UPI001443AD7B|nr:glycosyltransferase family 1 protein [Cellulomonas hominis]NKY10643.1 glycosyltransferase family 4 protein [Cellulomonas hominis]
MPDRVIAVDGTPLSRRTDGIGRWSANVVERTARARPAWEFVVVGFADDRRRPYLLPDLPNVRRVLLPVPRRLYQAWYSLVGPVAVDRFVPEVDALLATNFAPFPALRRVPSVVTVYDLTFVDLPEVVERRNLAHLRRHVPRALRTADVVTTISPFTAQRIDEVFPGHRPVRVVDCGLAPAFLRAEHVPGPPLPERYVLAVGTLEPRKNLVTLLRAWALLPDALRREVRLVVVGSAGWGPHARPSDVPADILEGVVFTGYVDDEQLPSVYAGARAFAFPSVYEGFGLPLLEAMSSGVPAVVSDIPPFRAIGGDLVEYAAPRDPVAFAEALTGVLTRPDASRVARARDRARAWTWEASGEQMARAIEEVLP